MSALSSPLRQVLLFFVAACALTAACQWPAIAAIRAGEQPAGVQLPLMAIGSSGPTIVAIILALALEGRAGLRALFRIGVKTMNRARLALPAIGHVFAAHMIASGALFVVGQYTAQHLAYPPTKFEHVAIAIIAPLGEEYGWRGYALPRLQRVMSPLAASVLIGVVWALWHVPTFFMPGVGMSMLAIFLCMMIAGSIIYTWLFNASGGSMLLIALAHLGAHLDGLGRAQELGDGLQPIIGATVVLMIFAVIVVLTGRVRRENAVTV
jgi:membrane protease YdiL (CAAX protease family)